MVAVLLHKCCFYCIFSTQTGRNRRGGPGGLNKLCGVSHDLQTIVGEEKMPRTEIVKQLWTYIKVNQLEDPMNSMAIQWDAKLQQLLGCESIYALGVPEMLTPIICLRDLDS
nr:Upstream activation factor subunit spp27 like [Ipomoea trifida]